MFLCEGSRVVLQAVWWHKHREVRLHLSVKSYVADHNWWSIVGCQNNQAVTQLASALKHHIRAKSMWQPAVHLQICSKSKRLFVSWNPAFICENYSALIIPRAPVLSWTAILSASKPRLRSLPTPLFMKYSFFGRRWSGRPIFTDWSEHVMWTLDTNVSLN